MFSHKPGKGKLHDVVNIIIDSLQASFSNENEDSKLFY